MKSIYTSDTSISRKVFLTCFLFIFCSLLLNNQVAQAKVPKRFKVDDVNLNIRDNIVETVSSFNMSLSSLSTEAINHGVPVKIVLRFAIPIDLILFTNYKEISRTEYQISRQALSGTYRLKNLTSLRNHQFQTIDDALREISSIHVENFDLNSLEGKNLAVRIHLDLFDLPSQIRAKAFFSGRWRHNSGWSIWSVPQ